METILIIFVILNIIFILVLGSVVLLFGYVIISITTGVRNKHIEKLLDILFEWVDKLDKQHKT